MRRLNLGFTLLFLVAAILIVAPTVVFWWEFSFEAVLHYWAWVAYLVLLTTLGTVLLMTARARPGQPQIVDQSSRGRLFLGKAMFVLVAGILVFAPTVAFGWIFGINAVLAYWASVCLLVVMSFSGLYLIFTDKSRTRQSP
jgi:hypothetical protein